MQQFKINFALKYQSSYVKSIVWLFILVFVKRILLSMTVSSKDFMVLIGSLGIFLLLSHSYKANKYTIKYFPYLYAILSYYSHVVFIFRGSYELETDPSTVMMSKDDLFRQIIQFASLGVNTIFVGIFLVISRRDCIMLNFLIWSLFIHDVFNQEGNLTSYLNL